MRLLVVTQGEYGRRMLENIRRRLRQGRHTPEDATSSGWPWIVDEWAAPSVLPPIIDDPEEFLPAEMAATDLILSLGEHPGTAQLLPDLARLTGAKSVIAAIDREVWLPTGLRHQLEGWLTEIGVSAVFPKPLCSLGANHYGYDKQAVAYDDPLISEFARYFGQPSFRIKSQDGDIVEIEVVRDATCGAARFVARELLGVGVDDAEQAAGLLHHHYPCLADMEIDSDLHDTLMHISGRIMKEAIEAEVRDAKTPTRYVVPGTLATE